MDPDFHRIINTSLLVISQRVLNSCVTAFMAFVYVCVCVFVLFTRVVLAALQLQQFLTIASSFSERVQTMQQWRSMESSARVDSFSNPFNRNMLSCSDVDWNYVHRFSDSSKETIKHTMLNQELVFRKQVFELHKLYREQIALMEDFKQKGLDNQNLRNIGMSPVSVNLNNQLKCSMKPLDLQLSADEFINQCADEFSGKRVVASLKESIVSKNSSCNRAVFDLDDPNMSLSIAQNAKIMGGEHRLWKGKETCSSSIGIIDLEDANICFLNYEASLKVDPGSSALKFHSGDGHQLDSFLRSDRQNFESFPQSGIKDGSYRATLSRSLVHAGPGSQTQPLSDSGLNRHHVISIAANTLSENQASPTCKVNILDLNMIQLENLSSPSNDHSVLVHSSITSSSPMLEKVYPKSNITSSVSPTSWREADVNQLTTLHDRHKDMNLEKREQCHKVGKLREGNGANIIFVNIDSDSSGELCNSRSGPKLLSVGSSSKILNGLSCEMDLVDAVGMKVILDTEMKPFEHPNCYKLSSSSESECIIDHQSSSIKTMQSGVECDDKNISTSVEREKFNIGPVVAHSGEQDLRSSDSTESNTRCIITKESEVDGTVQTAAELLVKISLVTRACHQGDRAEMPLKKIHNEEEDQPQFSSESYESMVLKTEETSPSDYCVSSNAFVVDNSEKKDVQYKLKRGTRMKDFQKDILPCLSTLSRHEIREDVNILEGVIRSQDYKKMRSKMADGGGDWCSSTRSKRSKVSRRYYA